MIRVLAILAAGVAIAFAEPGCTPRPGAAGDPVPCWVTGPPAWTPKRVEVPAAAAGVCPKTVAT